MVINETLLSVTIQPGASTECIEYMTDGTLKIKIAKPPVEGAANKRLCELLAKKLRIAKSTINIVRGKKSRLKVVRIRGLSQTELVQLLSASK